MIIHSPEATAEYRRIYRDYEIISVRRVVHFEKQFARTLDLIDSWPQMYPVTAENPNCRRALMSKFPYFVYYQELSPTVREVVAIIHTSRQPGHWTENRVMEEAGVYA